MAANPGVFAVAMVTLALGIGANTAMFSVIHAVLLRPLPLTDPERLVTLRARIPRLNINTAFFEYNILGEWWRPRSRSFEGMAAYTPVAANLLQGDQPQRLRALRVNAAFFQVVGIRPAIGRDFLPEEDQPGAARAAILSDSLWKRRFGGDTGVIGRSIDLDRNTYTVVGVLPSDFDLQPEDVFIPIAHSTARAPGQPSVGAYARLKPGVSVRAAQTEIDGISRGWVEQYRYAPDWSVRVWPIREYLTRDVRSSVLILAAAVALVLLIACANVANLLLARAGARQREMAIRNALGAGRNRIIRQLLTESAMLGGMSAAAGLLLAWGLLRAIVAADITMPFLRHVSLNLTVLGFTLGASLLTSVLFGLAPALAAATTPAENLKQGGQGGGESVRRSRLRGALVVTEVALALLLVIGASLTIRSLARLEAVNPGFNPEGIVTADFALPQSGYAEPARRLNFFKALRERVAAVRGVQAVGLVSHLPFRGTKSGNAIVVEGAPPLAPGDRPVSFSRTIDPDYFKTLQVRLIRGRFFTDHEAGGPVAIINETMARRCWPNQDPIGKRFGGGGPRDPWISVVGVTADIHNTSLAEEPDLEYYMPYVVRPVPAMALVVRTSLDPSRFSVALRSAVRELDRDLPVSEVATLAAAISRSNSSRRFSVTLLGVFALLALVLASVGIYGVVSYSVTRRTHEIGIRLALGAARNRIAAMVVGRAVLLGAAGVAIGIGGSLALTRLIRSMLYGVSATDPAIFAAAALFLLAVSAVAAWVPARRASRVDPLVALRHE
jgi:putative ABC transport system permease protein